MSKVKTEAELILPSRQIGYSNSCAYGYISRAALVFMCIFGVSVFLCDSLSLEISKSAQFAVCLGFCVFYAVLGISKKFFLGGMALGIGAIAVWFLSAGSISRRMSTLYYACAAIYNAWFRRLDELGQNGALNNVISFNNVVRTLRLSEETCAFIAYFIIIALFAALCSLCILRRARVLPILFVGTAISTLIMYFGLCRDNFGFSVMIASICGITALSYYDSVYSSKKHLKKELGWVSRSKDSRRELKDTIRANSSLGGYCGIASALIALVLLLIPCRVDSEMRDIQSISHPLMRIENYIVAVANGDRPDAGALIFSGATKIDRRSTSAENRYFKGTRLFEIKTHIDTPIYLKSWTGLDYQGDYWNSASLGKIASYHNTFGNDFSPEQLTFDILEAIDPTLVSLKEKQNVVSHTELGYVSTAVHIKKLMPTANLIYMPTLSDRSVGMLEYGTRQTMKADYKNYYDGIFTDTSYMFVDEYSTVTNVPLLTNKSFGNNLQALIEYFSDQIDYISLVNQMISDGSSDAAIEDALNQADSTLPKYELSTGYIFPRGSNQLSMRYFYEMNDTQRRAIDKLIEDNSNYRNYVYDNYLRGCEGFEKFNELANSIIADSIGEEDLLDRVNNRFAFRDKTVMAIINYLSDNMTYTLTPKEPTPDRRYYNAAETFLFDTHEGYCVQYATSAVMLLRALGIPARYAEGYLVSEYSYLPAGGFARYVSTVKDENAHAWIEVYFDNYGWVQYEATAPYCDAMYVSSFSPSTRPSTSYDTGEIEDTLDLTPVSPVDKDEPLLSTRAVVVLVSVLLVCALVVVTIILLGKRAERLEKYRRSIISSALSRTLASDERKSLAKEIDDRIMNILLRKKLSPHNGEHFDSFALRVDEELGKFAASEFTAVSKAMLVCEFGNELSQAQLELIATYYSDLVEYTHRSANVVQKLLYRYFTVL